MKTRFFSTVRFLVLALFAFLPLQMHARGFINVKLYIDSFEQLRIPIFLVPQEILQPTIKNHDVKVSINKQIATTKVTQVFHNPNDYDVEGTYIFPIPENVSFDTFTMYVNEKPLAAKILDKDEARKIYEGIVRSRKDPALLEYVGRGMVQVRVYPMQAHSDVRISFEYSEILKADHGSIKYRHSLGTDKNSHSLFDNVSITVNIASEQNIVNLYSPTHELSIKKDGYTKATVSCEEKNVGSSRDFILYYTVPHDEIGFNVLTYKDGQEDGFFLAMISPNVSEISQPVIAKNILFVVDTSGSMWGKKMQQAQDALKFCLQNLNEHDRFNVIGFNYNIAMYKKGLVKASGSHVQQALSYVDSLRASGGTNIDGALEAALQQLPEGDTPNMIIFLTDGQPTVGECNVTRIIAKANKRNRANTRIFSFGVGNDVNTTLLDKISLDNNGASDYVRPFESVETVVVNFYKKVANPVLTDLILRVTGTDGKEIFPINLPDLFHGSQLLVLGRYTDGGMVTIDLSGKQNTIEKQYFFTTQFADNDTSNDFLPRLWAARKIASLIDTIVLEGKNKELVDEIIRLSKKYGIITEYTSFLIDIDAQEFTKDKISPKSMNMALGALDFASYDQVGESAVIRAKSQEMLRQCSTLCTNYATDEQGFAMQEKIRTICARTFYLKDGVWIDADHTDVSLITKIKLFSKKYFKFLKKNPDMGVYLALGKNVIIKTDTGSILVHDDDE